MKNKSPVRHLNPDGNDTKRILVLTADAGFGHRSAAKAIVAALYETYGEKCQVNMVNPLDDPRIPVLLRESQNDYDKLVNEMPRLYQLGYEATDSTVTSALVDGALIVVLFEVLRDILHRYQPDAIVTTYPLYQAPLGAVFLITNKYVPMLSVVTDLVSVHGQWFHKSADLCLVPTDVVRDQAIDHGLDPHKVHITGIPVNPDLAQDKDRTALRAEMGWEADLTTVLIVGSKRVGNMGDMLRALNHSGLPLQLVVVTGGNDVLYQQLQNVEWHKKALIYNFVTNLPDMMQAADFIICKAGGLIVSESLACGLPLLLIDVLPGQEVGNADYVVQHNAGQLAPNPLDALEIMYKWLAHDQALLVEMSLQARKLGQPRSAFTVADYVWGAAQRGSQSRKERPKRKSHDLITLLDRYRVPWQRE